MVKHISYFFAAVLTLLSHVGFAQVAGQLFYKKTIDDKIMSAARTENYIVYFNNNKSIEFLQVPVVANNAGFTMIDSATFSKSYSGGKRKPFTYKDLDTKKIQSGTNILFETYLIEDLLPNFKWVITKEQQKILKYNCTKALTTYKGREYIAWFTEDVPLQNGPWKFYGLPGLIVKINDAENIYTFELNGLDVKTKFDLSIINLPDAYKKDKPISNEEFLGLYVKKVNDLDLKARASYRVYAGGSSTSKIAVAPIMEKP